LQLTPDAMADVFSLFLASGSDSSIGEDE